MRSSITLVCCTVAALLCAAAIALQVEEPGLANSSHVTYATNATNLTVPQPFNDGGLPPLATTPGPVPNPAQANATARWEPTPHYKLPHYDLAGRVLWFPRIVGGSMATSGEFPAMVSLQLARNSAHVCGGTLLTMSQLLTAAHCVTDVRGVASPAAQYQAMGDDLFVLPSVGNPSRQVRPVRAITVHPQYDTASFANDLAIVRLASEFRQTQTFFPAKRLQRPPTPGDRCSLAGWGVTSEHSTVMSPNLQRINVVVGDFGTCNVAFDRQLFKGMLCAGAPGRDACQGDSGGALLCNGGRVAGIVSFGAGCAAPDIPGVYVDVVHYEKWINGVLRNGARRDAAGPLRLALAALFWALRYALRK